MKLDNLKVFNFEGAFRGMRNPMNSWEKSDSWFDICKKYHPVKAKEIAEKWVDKENQNILERKNKPLLTNKPIFVKNSVRFNRILDNYADWLYSNGCLNCGKEDNSIGEIAYLGPNDLELAQKLILAGGEHRKFLRQIIVSFDLTAPLYFWKEFDTYKIGTVSNSTSTMHKLTSTPITLDCFEIDDYEPALRYLNGIDDSGDYPFPYYLEVKDMVESSGLNSYDEPSLIQFLEELRQAYIETKNKKYWKELIRWLPESWLQTRTITMNYENVLNIVNQRNNHKLSEWKWLVNEFKMLPYSYELLYFTLNEEDKK